jgi:hypothetical protein
MAQVTRNSSADAKLSNWDAQSTAPTLASSETASIKGASPASETSTSRKVWDKIKKAAKEHHESVNGAYQAYYNPGGFRYDIK